MILFYSHLLSDLQEIYDAIEKLPVSEKEKREAKHIVEKTIYYAVIDILLEYLREEHHEQVLLEIYRTPQNRGILTLAHSLSGENIETILRVRLRDLHVELLRDLRG